MFSTRFTTPVCPVILVGDRRGLTHLHLETGQGARRFETDPQWVRDDPFFTDAVAQIRGYFNGSLRRFELKLNPRGTAFQLCVWQALRSIPFGQTRTYKDIALAIGRPQAARAVGRANASNPLPLIVPCHRVIGAGGKLTGFAHGLAMKQTLIDLERAPAGCSAPPP